MHAWRSQRLTWVSSSFDPQAYLLRQILSLNTGWLDNELQGSPCLHLHSVGNFRHATSPGFFIVTGDLNSVFIIAQQVLYQNNPSELSERTLSGSRTLLLFISC
jgi:hypothetical protein